MSNTDNKVGAGDLLSCLCKLSYNESCILFFTEQLSLRRVGLCETFLRRTITYPTHDHMFTRIQHSHNTRKKDKIFRGVKCENLGCVQHFIKIHIYVHYHCKSLDNEPSKMLSYKFPEKWIVIFSVLPLYWLEINKPEI